MKNEHSSDIHPITVKMNRYQLYPPAMLTQRDCLIQR